MKQDDGPEGCGSVRAIVAGAGAASDAPLIVAEGDAAGATTPLGASAACAAVWHSDAAVEESDESEDAAVEEMDDAAVESSTPLPTADGVHGPSAAGAVSGDCSAAGAAPLVELLLRCATRSGAGAMASYGLMRRMRRNSALNISGTFWS